jgi:hypothetical protein
MTYIITPEEEEEENNTKKNKRFSIRNRHERELLFNHFSQIPNINKRKCSEWWDDNRAEFMKSTGLSISAQNYIRNFKRYRGGYGNR